MYILGLIVILDGKRWRYFTVSRGAMEGRAQSREGLLELVYLAS